MLILAAALADPAGRRQASRALAGWLGAEELIVFLPDPELEVLLPAPGFPQTLPQGRAWRAFLSECVPGRLATARLAFPGAQAQPVLGVAGSDGTVLVLVGGAPHSADVAEVCLLLPLLAAAFRGERAALTSEGQAGVARVAAAQASALVESLDRARRDLGDADRRKDEFLATLAHELRNPLAPIRNGLQVLRLAGHDRRAVEQVHEIIGRQVQHLVRLVDDLLEVSHISRGRIELRKERVELAAVIQSAVETSGPLIEASGHKLTVALPPAPLYLDADCTRLAQVLANLLNNSAKYTESGGDISLVAERDGGDVTFRVRDNGLGIPAEMLPRIFDMFVQVDGSIRRRQGGLGIGLTLVKELVEMHGGSVEAHSAGLRQGSEFIVRLPLAAESRTTQGQEPSTLSFRPEDEAPALRILVVDDNKDSAESLGMLLRLAGQDVRIAHDGPAALDAARTYRPDLVLQDIGMPGMSGYEVARHLREHPATKKVVLVAITGYGQEEDRLRSRKAGFDEHLVKPVDFEALRSLLTSLQAQAAGIAQNLT